MLAAMVPGFTGQARVGRPRAAPRRHRRAAPRQKLCASAGAGLHCATQPRPICARPGTQWDRARSAGGCPARPARFRVRLPPARLASLVSPWKTPAVPPVRARAGCFLGVIGRTVHGRSGV